MIQPHAPAAALPQLPIDLPTGETDVRKMRVWAGELVRKCRSFKPRPRRRFRFARDLVEDLSRLLAPLL